MKRKVIISLVMVLILFSFQHTMSDKKDMFVFEDVKETDWYYIPVTQLARNGIIPDTNTFSGESAAKRAEIAQSLYKLSLCINKKTDIKNPQKFTDVDKDSGYYDAICWASANGIINGFEDNTFRLDAPCDREQVCTMAIRYFDLLNINPKAICEEEQFADSLEISQYARSYVAAARICGLINGDERGFFNPLASITKAESAAIVYSMMNICVTDKNDDAPRIKTEKDAYNHLYNNYKTAEEYLFKAYVTESEAVDLSYFDDAVLIGDSVTLSLQFYAAATGELGNAKFLCAGSLSPKNALWEVSSESVHPVVGGVKMKLEDAVPKIGAKKVYVMLGMNSIALGLDESVRDLETVIDKIKANAPEVEILVQSVTPMVNTSKILSKNLNNARIAEYNEKVLELCGRKGWYYIDVAEKMREADGTLKKAYCSDPADMGIHFTMAADKVWIDYLKTHVPEKLR